MLMMSNWPLEDWGGPQGDTRAATAIRDRFLHHADVIPMKGRSYRLKDASSAPTQDDKDACAPGRESVQ